MPRYSYTAMDSGGQMQTARGDFPSVPDMFQTLNHRGLELIEYRRIYFSGNFNIMSRSIKRTELSEFFRNLALLLRGGIPLRDALEDLIAGGGRSTLALVFSRIQSRLEEGMLFSEALEQETKYIPRIILPLVAIGEETGQLDETLSDAATHLDRIQKIISATRGALIYPCFILVAMFGAFLFWMIFVLPQLLELFTTMGLTDLPLATRVLIASVHYFDIFWPVIPVGIGAFIFVYFLSRKNERLRYLWDSCLNHIPVLGGVLRSSQLAFFFEYSSLLTAGGINIVRSLELMKVSVENRVLKKSLNLITVDIIAGDSMSSAISNLKFFEPFVLRMVRVGEQTGNMPEQFKILAGYYMDRVNKIVETMSKTLEPVIIGIAGLVFMVIAMGLLGPVYNLVSSIQ
jgi:type IV pilus assembly protein PilC